VGGGGEKRNTLLLPRATGQVWRLTRERPEKDRNDAGRQRWGDVKKGRWGEGDREGGGGLLEDDKKGAQHLPGGKIKGGTCF